MLKQAKERNGTRNRTAGLQGLTRLPCVHITVHLSSFSWRCKGLNLGPSTHNAQSGGPRYFCLLQNPHIGPLSRPVLLGVALQVTLDHSPFENHSLERPWIEPSHACALQPLRYSYSLRAGQFFSREKNQRKETVCRKSVPKRLMSRKMAFGMYLCFHAQSISSRNLSAIWFWVALHKGEGGKPLSGLPGDSPASSFHTFLM